jgi:type I restriction enzyme S subunit
MSVRLDNSLRNLGEVPKGWEVVPFSSTGRFINGRAFKPLDWKKEGLPIIRIQNLNDPEADFNYFDGDVESQHVVEPGDILLSWSASLGIYLWKGNKAILNQHIFKVLPDAGIDKSYFYYMAHRAIADLGRRVHGSTMHHFKKGELDNTSVSLPPFAEQRKIGMILEAVDNTIEKTGEIIATTQQLKKGLMQQLLTRGIGHSEFKETEIGEIPEEWGVAYLSEVCEKIQDGTHFSPAAVTHGIPYITSKNIRPWGIDVTDVSYVSKKAHEEVYKRCDPRYGDVLYVKDGVNTGTVVVNTLHYEFTLLSSVAMLRPKHDVLDPWFLKYALDAPSIKSKHLGVMTGTAIRRLTLERIKQLQVPCPPIQEQRMISSILSAMENKIESERSTSASLARLKKGLMQVLLTGKVRVKVN